MSNSSSISHFLPLELADTRQLQLLHFCFFLGISLAALLGNGLIISAIACGHLLHMPMFFFLLNLALTNLGSICTTVPKPCTIPSGTPGTSPVQDVLLSVLGKKERVRERLAPFYVFIIKLGSGGDLACSVGNAEEEIVIYWDS
ncbi:hypothetical protein DUI87_30674 [Hirundo rustica rustica]|uniref:G-protein coupled receptors family 1 profile domain-containing protein n=1 Tax=Hirundo rustica rustica TaxID=333673 RepID=A0A3M0IW91_HIRRU|nr:hypothetical protein DUI87_30674 [Hirundo rustica rustica]